MAEWQLSTSWQTPAPVRQAQGDPCFLGGILGERLVNCVRLLWEGEVDF